MPFSKSHFIFLIFTSVLLSNCGKSADQKNLELREMEVTRKEQRLQALEQLLNSKDQELAKREQLLDSLQSSSDTNGVYNAKLIGNWTVNMKCIETSCEGSALGDTKTERWKIFYQSNRIVVRASSNKTLARLYSGSYNENGLKLSAQQQKGDSATIITINLNQISDNKMEGKREVNQGGNCKIIYAIELSKIQTTSFQF